METGIVPDCTGRRYIILTPDGRRLETRLRGRLRLNGSRTTNPVAVGDRVLYEETPEGATITAVEPRRNYLIRRASNLSKESHVIASNLDRALLVATLFSPVTNTEFIDRFLVTCEAYAIPAAIVLNKLDLAAERPDELDEFIAIYETAGYAVYPVSATEGTGLETLRELTAGKTTLLTGNSGAGKSTLIKALVPDADVRINRISEYHHKGMHTTTFARMYPLAGGGNIIDTPGIKGFGLVDIEPGEVFRYFPEFMRHSPDCQYYNCTHTHEPGCAVTAAVERGDIAPQRYISYIKLLDEDGKYRQCRNAQPGVVSSAHRLPLAVHPARTIRNLPTGTLHAYPVDDRLHGEHLSSAKRERHHPQLRGVRHSGHTHRRNALPLQSQHPHRQGNGQGD